MIDKFVNAKNNPNLDSHIDVYIKDGIVYLINDNDDYIIQLTKEDAIELSKQILKLTKDER